MSKFEDLSNIELEYKKIKYINFEEIIKDISQENQDVKN